MRDAHCRISSDGSSISASRSVRNRSSPAAGGVFRGGTTLKRRWCSYGTEASPCDPRGPYSDSDCALQSHSGNGGAPPAVLRNPARPARPALHALGDAWDRSLREEERLKMNYGE